MSGARERAPMDPEMRAFLDATTDTATQERDPLETPLPEMRRAMEAGRIGYAAGGPPMREAVDRALEGPGRLILARFNMPDAEGPLPAFVLLHGGGWTWNTIYTATARRANMPPARARRSSRRTTRSRRSTSFLRRCMSAWRRSGRCAPGPRSGASTRTGSRSAGIRRRQPGARRRAGAAGRGRGTGSAARLLNYGVFDSDFSRESYRLYGGGDLYLSSRLMRFFWNNYVSTPDQMAHPLAAPLRADLAGLPPLRIAAAELDVLADESLALAEKAKLAGGGYRICALYGHRPRLPARRRLGRQGRTRPRRRRRLAETNPRPITEYRSHAGRTPFLLLHHGLALDLSRP